MPYAGPDHPAGQAGPQDDATVEFPRPTDAMIDAVMDDDLATLEFPRITADGPADAPAPAGAGAAAVPVLGAGVELVGEYQGSGLTQVTFLARNTAGQVVQLSRLLWLVLSGVDGTRTAGEIATRASVEFGKTVSAGNVEYLLENKLIPLGLVAGGGDAPDAATPAAAPDAALLTLRLRGTLIGENGVQVMARLFGPLFLPPVVAVMLAALAGADVWLLRSGVLLASFHEVLARPLLLLVVLGLSVVSMVFHECGHAAACRYGGARPGRIGMGLYVLWPALFTNVTDSYRLGRAGRIRTDLGGVYFNAVFAVALAGAYRGTGYLPLAATVLLVQVELAQQLLPSLRLDGYFILTDLVGVPDLFRQIGPVLRSLIPGQPADPRVGALRRGSRIALTAWVLVIVPLLGGELVLLLLGIPRLYAVFAQTVQAQATAITAQFGRGQVAAGLVSVISLVLAVFPAVGLCYVLLQSGRTAFRAGRAAARSHPLLRAPLAAAALAAAAGLAAAWGVLPMPSQHPAVAAAAPELSAAPSVSPVPIALAAADSDSSPWPTQLLGRDVSPPAAPGTRQAARRRHRARHQAEAGERSAGPVRMLASPSPSASARPRTSAKATASAKPTARPSASAKPTVSASPSGTASSSPSATPSSGTPGPPPVQSPPSEASSGLD